MLVPFALFLLLFAQSEVTVASESDPCELTGPEAKAACSAKLD